MDDNFSTWITTWNFELSKLMGTRRLLEFALINEHLYREREEPD